MCSSSGFPLWHWWSHWRPGKIETRYLLSHIRENRQRPEIGFHFDEGGSVTYNCHSILLFNLFPSSFLSFSSFFPSYSLLTLIHLLVLSFFSFSNLSVWHWGWTIWTENRPQRFWSLWWLHAQQWDEWRGWCGRTALWEGVSTWLETGPSLLVQACQSRTFQSTVSKFSTISFQFFFCQCSLPSKMHHTVDCICAQFDF